MVEFEKTRWFRIVALVAIFVVVAGAGTMIFAKQRADAAKPSVAIAGGGFLYYYRIGEIRAGITAVVQKPVGYATRLVATFHVGDGAPAVVTRKVTFASKTYGLETDALTGVEAGRDYLVTLDVLTPTGELLESQSRTIVSNVDPSVVPDRPLTIGPGYARNPAAGD